MTIKIEIEEGRFLEAELVNSMELNRIARYGGLGLTYLMNVIDINSPYNTEYMWFKDDRTDKSYLMDITKKHIKRKSNND